MWIKRWKKLEGQVLESEKVLYPFFLSGFIRISFYTYVCKHEWMNGYMYLSTHNLFMYQEGGFSMYGCCQKSAFYYLNKGWRTERRGRGSYLIAKNGVDVIIDLLIHFVRVRLVIFCRIRACFALEIWRPSCLMLIFTWWKLQGPVISDLPKTLPRSQKTSLCCFTFWKVNFFTEV